MQHLCLLCKQALSRACVSCSAKCCSRAAVSPHWLLFVAAVASHSPLLCFRCVCRKKAKTAAPFSAAPAAPASEWDAVEATPAVNRWDATPGQAPSDTPGRIWAGGAEATPAGSWGAPDGGAAAAPQPKRNRWDATPTPGHGTGEAGVGETPTAGGKRSRWDATPAMGAMGATPAYGAALGATPMYGATPAGGLGMETPTPGMLAAQQAAMAAVAMTPEAYQQAKVEREMDERNR